MDAMIISPLFVIRSHINQIFFRKFREKKKNPLYFFIVT